MGALAAVLVLGATQSATQFNSVATTNVATRVAPAGYVANVAPGAFVQATSFDQVRSAAPVTPEAGSPFALEGATYTSPLKVISASFMGVAAFAGIVAAWASNTGSQEERVALMAVTSKEGVPYKTAQVEDMQELINERGFTLVDIRSPDEVAETGSKFSWTKIPLAAMTDDGPVMNPYFCAQVKEAFPNAMSRIIVACDDGSDRSEIAAELICEKMKYTQIHILEGGINEYIKAYPLTEADKTKWKMSDEDMAGPDLSDLITGVDTRQAGEKFY